MGFRKKTFNLLATSNHPSVPCVGGNGLKTMLNVHHYSRAIFSWINLENDGRMTFDEYFLYYIF